MARGSVESVTTEVWQDMLGGPLRGWMSRMCVPSTKLFLMDKYFSEMEKNWQIHDMVQGGPGEDVELLREQLRSLNSEMLSLQTSLCQASGSVNTSQQSPKQDRKISPDSGFHEGSSPVLAHIHNSYSSSNLTMYTQMSDLINLSGPLTEDALIKTLQARFYNGHLYTNVGPVLVLVNPQAEVLGPRALSESCSCPQLQAVVRQAYTQQMDTGHAQTILLNGVSGSGKSHTAMKLLRELFHTAGGGTETDSFKHLRASFTVLRSLGSAATVANPESSRMGYFIESHVTDGAIYRTKIHCYFSDSSRVIQAAPKEKNYHIFYQVLAGLTQEEKVKYHLQGFSIPNLRCLSTGDILQNEAEDKVRFHAWKSSLAVLGIPLSDILRVLAAIMLMSNMVFVEGTGLELDIRGNNEMKSVAALLGVSGVTLYRGFTMRTRRARGQVFKALADVTSANQTRDALAKALYCRTVAAIVKRANSTKRPASNSTTGSSDSSNDSGPQVCEVPSAQSSPSESQISGKTPSRSSSFNCSQRPQVDAFIGILDMFGFENAEANGLEQMCVNMCAETLQHFYNTHIFKAPLEACTEEGIQAEMDVNFFDNTPVIELLSSQLLDPISGEKMSRFVCNMLFWREGVELLGRMCQTTNRNLVGATAKRIGLLSLMDAECALARGTTEAYMQKIRVQHKKNSHFSEPTSSEGPCFTVCHYMDSVTYSASNFLTYNKDRLPDDIVWTFARQNCNFGFVSHLFAAEHRLMHEESGGTGPCGSTYRTVQTSPSEHSGDLPGTLSQDFQTRLDGLLQTIVHSQPHFVRCIKSNCQGQRELFERELVVRQVRGQQLLETLHLMAGGFPHHMHYRVFNWRYRLLVRPAARKGGGTHNSDKPYEETKVILDHFLRAMDESKLPYVSAQWALGKKSIFLSEEARQQFELMRRQKQTQAATVIQANWKRRMCVKKWPTLKRQLKLRNRDRSPVRKHTRRHSLMDASDLKNCDPSVLQQTCSINGLDMDKPPPLPASRKYTVKGNVKVSYPQTRVLTQDIPEYSMQAGQDIKVVGASPKRGFLLVEWGKSAVLIPFQLTKIKPASRTRRSSTSHLPGVDV